MNLEAIHRFARSNYGLVHRAFILEAGGTDHQIALQLQSGRWRAIYPGVYQIDISALSWHATLRASTLAAGPLSVVSHRTAVRLWSMEGIDHAPIEVTVPFGHLPVPEGIIVHRTRRLQEGTVVAGIPVTTPERTILDTARFAPTPVVEQVYDSGIRKRLITMESMAQCLNDFGTRGVRGRTKVLRVLEDRLEGNPLGSPAETAVLRHLRQAGVEEPHRQYVIVAPDGRVIILDLAWPRPLKAVEIDGLAAHSSASKLTDDLERQNLIFECGWQLRRFSARTVRQHPRLVVAEIQAFLAA